MLLLVLASGADLRAQTSPGDPVDVQSRLGVQVNLNLPKKWESSVGYEARMTGNSSVYHGSYFSAELGRRLGKRVTISTDYRLAIASVVSHRFGFGAELETKRHQVAFSLRALFQYQRSVVDDAEQGSREVFRTRVRAKLPAAKRVTLYGSVEPYFSFTGLYPVDNWSNTAGMQWEFLKHRKLDVHYTYRPDYGKLYNRTYHIFAAEFSMDLKL